MPEPLRSGRRLRSLSSLAAAEAARDTAEMVPPAQVTKEKELLDAKIYGIMVYTVYTVYGIWYSISIVLV